MARKYAESTHVTSSRSKAEIESVLQRYGATQFLSGWDEAKGMAMIGFTVEDEDEKARQVRLRLLMPDHAGFSVTETGRDRSDAQASTAWEKECRRLWRSLLLVIKAKLEACDAGISSIEREFLADIVLPDGSTVGDWVNPQIAAVYEHGKMPALLPAPERRRKST